VVGTGAFIFGWASLSLDLRDKSCGQTTPGWGVVTPLGRHPITSRAHVYMVQGEEGTEFTRYTERNQTDLSPSMSSAVAKGGLITYSIQVKSDGPERARGVRSWRSTTTLAPRSLTRAPGDAGPAFGSPLT
jgi:hypothetical protein